MWSDRGDLMGFWEHGAKFYVCGSRAVASEVGVVAKRIVTERLGGQIGGDEAEEWLSMMKNQRFVSDIFT